MIILHFDLQPQLKYMNYFIYTSHQILYLFNIFRYILLKLLKYTQGVMQLVNTEQGIVPSAMVNSGLSLFLGLPSFTCRGKLIYQFSHYIFFKRQFYLIIIIL